MSDTLGPSADKSTEEPSTAEPSTAEPATLEEKAIEVLNPNRAAPRRVPTGTCLESPIL